MSFLETKHKKKSAIITSVILVLILVGIFNFGMQYLDPPDEYGLAINFGDSNVGNGDPVVKTKENPKVKKVEQKVEEKVEEKVVPKETIKDKVITQDTKDAPVIEKSTKKKIEKPKEDKKKVEKPKDKPKQKKPSKKTQDLLNNLLKGNSKDGDNKGEGNDNNSGVKGNIKGDPKSSKYYGNKGTDGDKNYNLAGRNALSKPIEKPDCNEEGIVVVSIEVDNSGKVIKATPGVKGSTNTAKCLLDPAKSAALKTKWNLDQNAPNKQRGTIIYRFSLSQ